MASRDESRRTRAGSRDHRASGRARRSSAPRTATTRSAGARTVGARTGGAGRAVSVIETGEQELITDNDNIVDGDDVSADSVGVSAGRRRAGAIRARRGTRGLASSAGDRMRRLDPRHAVLLALVVSVVALTLAMPMRTYFGQRSEFSSLAASNQQLEHQVADYQRKVNEQNDPAYIEAKARQRLQFVRPGETPLVMIYPGDKQREDAQKRAEEHANTPWYVNLWQSVATPPTRR